LLAIGFPARIAFTLAVGAWVAVELHLGHRSMWTAEALAAPWSEVLISVSTVVALVAAVLATSIPNAQIRPPGSVFVLGLAMMLAGVAIRTLEARSLGRYYTLNLGIQPGQAVRDAGLYRARRAVTKGRFRRRLRRAPAGAFCPASCEDVSAYTARDGVR
jgi:protein-S-isoprenylcysteine O-methyltransferase Ste14